MKFVWNDSSRPQGRDVDSGKNLGSDTARKVKSLVIKLIGSEDFDVTSTAAVMDISPRTLRKLLYQDHLSSKTLKKIQLWAAKQ